ncbi:hypothetical protein EJB05_00599, partial [Eragrostis curvula]
LYGAGAVAPDPAGDTVAASCDAIRDFVDVAFCVSHLRSVPGAATAGRRGHLLMAADMAAAAGSAALDAAASAAARGDPAAQDALRACEFVYGAASVPALRFMRGYAAAGSWAAARSLLSLTPQGGIGCEAALKGAAAGTAAAGDMAAANREFSQLNAMVTALLNAVS